jgi:hypothetical protein
MVFPMRGFRATPEVVIVPIGSGSSSDSRFLRLEIFMRRLAAAFVLVLTCAVPTLAAELPLRKAGLWEMTTTSNGGTVPIKQCIDAASDQAMQANAGPTLQRSCSKRDVQKSGDTTTVDSVCTGATGKTSTNHMVITGSFESAYTMTITTQREGIPAPSTITIAAKWAGPCAADQKPGDMIMPDGRKVNLTDMQKRAGQFGAPPPGSGKPAN